MKQQLKLLAQIIKQTVEDDQFKLVINKQHKQEVKRKKIKINTIIQQQKPTQITQISNKKVRNYKKGIYKHNNISLFNLQDLISLSQKGVEGDMDVEVGDKKGVVGDMDVNKQELEVDKQEELEDKQEQQEQDKQEQLKVDKQEELDKQDKYQDKQQGNKQKVDNQDQNNENHINNINDKVDKLDNQDYTNYNNNININVNVNGQYQYDQYNNPFQQDIQNQLYLNALLQQNCLQNLYNQDYTLINSNINQDLFKSKDQFQIINYHHQPQNIPKSNRRSKQKLRTFN